MARMFDGNEIIAIERRATEKFGEVIPGLTGLLREVRMNRARMIELADSIRGETVVSKRRLRDECSCEYIKNPSVQNDLDVQKITDYSDSLRMINERLMICEYHGKSDQIGALHREIVGITSYNIDLGDEIEGAIQSVMKRFGPLIGG
jgi:hypothetical protein